MRIRLLVVMLGAALLAVLALPSAEGQTTEPETVVSVASLGVATDVVNGRIAATQSIETTGEVHTLALLQISSTIEGSLGGDVFIAVPGGVANNGLQISVSHQPKFRVGDQVQVALVRMTPEQELALVGGGAVYSVVGGLDGAAAFSGSLLSQAQAAGDYVLTGTKWDPTDSERWPIPYRINWRNSGLSKAATIATLNRSIGTWVADPGSDIEFNYLGETTASPSNFSDAHNTIGFVTTPNAGDLYLAQAIWATGGDVTVSFDIRFNRDYPFSDGAASGSYDMDTINLHEIGHVLGLGHAPASSEVMYGSIPSNAAKGLGSGDRTGVAGMYPAAKRPAVENGPLPQTFSQAGCAGLDFTVHIGLGELPTHGDDIILGTDGDDRIWGLGGDDIICAGAGNDRIIGGDGDDLISGGSGSDFIDGRDGNDVVAGDAEKDWLYGGNGNDRIFGNSGDDKIVGGNGDDYHSGGWGNDLIYGRSGSDVIYGDRDDDRLFGGSESDFVDGGTGIDKVVGDSGDDELHGGSADDRLYGKSGNDSLNGGSGNDRTVGGSGRDGCNGSTGSDVGVSCELLSSLERLV